MRKGLFTSLVLVFLFSTAASIIDRETKQGVLGLEERFDQFIQIELSRHTEQMKLLQEQRDILQKILQMQSPMAQAPVSIQPLPMTAVPSMQAIQALPPPLPSSGVVPPVSTGFPRPMEAPVVSAVVVKPQDLPKPVVVEEAPSSSIGSSSGVLSFLVLASLAVIAGLVVVILRMRNSEERARKTVWKSEVETLRSDFVQGRPIVKILVVGDRMELTNTGETSADDIRLMVGTGPSTMKQKVKTTHRIRAGERVSFDLPLHISNGPLYASLEYRNPNNGRTYKDTFVLTADRMTGGLAPAREAS